MLQLPVFNGKDGKIFLTEEEQMAEKRQNFGKCNNVKF